jgi:RNA recognition motif-containing protein
MAAQQTQTQNNNKHNLNINNMSNNMNNEKVSRVCIKGLPPSCTEANLKSHLSNSSKSNNRQSVIVTDCKILKTQDGKSRKLAFVGFKTPDVSTIQMHVDKHTCTYTYMYIRIRVDYTYLFMLNWLSS